MNKKLVLMMMVILFLGLALGSFFVVFNNSSHSELPEKTKTFQQVTKKKTPAKNTPNQVIKPTQIQNKTVKNNSESLNTKNEKITVKSYSTVKSDATPTRGKTLKSSDKFSSELTLKLIDAATKKVLRNTEGRLSFTINRENTITMKFKSDKKGMIVIKTQAKGSCRLVLDITNYTVRQKYKNIKLSKEFETIELFKGGGTLNIIALDMNGNNLDKIQVKISGKRQRPGQDISPFKYHYDTFSLKHIYSNLSIGLSEVVVEAEGFVISETYKVNISGHDATELNVQLKKSSLLKFNLVGIKKLPSTIRIQSFSAITNSNNFKPTFFHVSSKEISLDEKNQYIFENKFDTVVRLKLIVDGYQPITLLLQPNKTNYNIILKKGISYKLKILNEQKKPIAGIEVKYKTDKVQKIAVSDIKGEVILSGVIPDKSLYMIIRSKGYFPFHQYIKKLKPDNNQVIGHVKEITLKSAAFLEGTITHKGKIIVSAKVLLKSKKVKRGVPNSRTVLSDEKGNFAFEGIKKGNYIISAHHQDFGMSKKKNITITDKHKGLNLELKSGEKYQIIFRLENNTPFKLKKIQLSGNNKSVLLTTDKEGLLQINNLDKGKYFIHFSDQNYQTKKRFFNLPSENKSIISVSKKSMLTFSLYGENGQRITEGVRLSAFQFNFNRRVSFKILDDGIFEFRPELRKRLLGKVFYRLEVKGYMPEKIGPFSAAWEGNKEFQIDLKKSTKVKINLTDLSTGFNMKSAPIELWTFGQKSSVLSTDEFGELSVYKPHHTFDIKVNVKGYAPLVFHYLKSSKETIQLKLMKGGSVNGNFTINNTMTNAVIYLYKKSQKHHQGTHARINMKNGTFNFEHIPPGNYNVLIAIKKKSGKIENKQQAPLTIEDEKETTINFSKN